MPARDLAADGVSAGVAAFMVSPFMVVVDKAVAQNASGEQQLWSSFFRSCRDMTRRPLAFVRQPAFGYIYCTIGGTYLACNLFTSLEEAWRESHVVAKAATMFAVNTTLSLWKDAAYAQLFSGKKPAPVPYPALAAWWLRDGRQLGHLCRAARRVALAGRRAPVRITRDAHHNLLSGDVPDAVLAFPEA